MRPGDGAVRLDVGADIDFGHERTRGLRFFVGCLTIKTQRTASGVHVLKAENGDEKRFDVNFVLKKSDSRWIIVEAGATAIR